MQLSSVDFKLDKKKISHNEPSLKYVYNQGLRNIYWLTCQLFFVIFLKFLGIKTVAFYDRKPLK